MLSNILISTKLKLNTAIVLIGLISLAMLSYINIKDLEQLHKQQKEISTQLSHNKSILIGGLLVNSASYVFALDPKNLKPIKSAQSGLNKVKDFYTKVTNKNEKLFKNFIMSAEKTINFAQKNKYIDPQTANALVKTWRPLKMDIMKKLKKLKRGEKLLSQAFNDSLTQLFIKIFTIIIIITLIVSVLNYLIAAGIIKSIGKLENSMKDLSEGKSSGIIEMEHNDETAAVANYFNQYMNNIEKGLEQDKLVINEVKSVITKVNAGLFNTTIKQTPNSKEVQELVDALNHMIKNTHTNLNDLSLTLRELANSNFDVPMRHIPGLTGTIASMFSGLRATRNTVQELLALIDNSNKKLLYSSNELSSSAETLNKASTNQASSLEETAASIEEVTTTISQSSQNTIEMNQYANKVIKSLKTGEQLAEDTANSMDEINTQVTAINEAITVIDQIAFQTNILSLNAAVEAATAGEAGKGFAVVAGEVRNLASRSAEAANEIKALVETAANKANEGKKIATEMIDGYGELNLNVTHTTELIDQVASAAKEQESAMKQINNAISDLDQTTQNNAAEASNISRMAKENEKLAGVLQSAVDKTSFDKSAKERVCDVDLIFETTKLKLSHIDLKDDAIERAGQGKHFTVKSHNECGLGCWINKQNSEFTNSKEFEELKTAHENMHIKTQQLVDLHMQPNNDSQIIAVANEIEENIDIVFDKLNQIRKVNCDHEFAKRKQKQYETTNVTTISKKSKPSQTVQSCGCTHT